MKKLSDIGEREAIKIIINLLKDEKESEIGDDCAKLDFYDKYLLASTDVISEMTHIPKDTNPWQIGWFAVAVNLSDIAAKGGQPLGILLSLGLPRNKNEAFFNE